MNQRGTHQIIHHRIRKPLGLFLVMAVAGCVSGTARSGPARAAQREDADVPFADPTSLDPKVPTPESVVGHRMGDGAIRYNELIRYLKALAEASPYVTMAPYAVSHEGRTLHVLTITSEKNHARLSDIKKANAKLGDPRKLGSDGEADRIIRDLPGIAWMAYGIHGDELSSVDAAVQLAYRLAAGTDPDTRRLRDELVIHIDPTMNPDGRERYLNQLQSLTGKVPNPDYQAMQHAGLWSAGRGNHYLFDLNRDWLMQVHPETRGRAAKIIEWNPHLVVDSHEMGSLDTYLFDPPREPFNVNLTPKNLQWRRRFSADQAKAFDAHGWSYYTREWYEEWYPGYTNSWVNLQGGIGLLYEQAGVNATAIKQPAGNVLTYREAVLHHYVSSLANLHTLLENRVEILRNFYDDRKAAVVPNSVGASTFLMPPPADHARFNQFCDLLRREGLEIGFAADAFTAEGVTDAWGTRLENRRFSSGTLVVRSAQPRRRLLRAILEFDPHMSDKYLHDERADLENHRGTRSYDITAWNLSMAYGLEAYWADAIGSVKVDDRRPTDVRFAPRPASYGYLIDGASLDIHKAVVGLMERSCKVRVALESFTVAGHDYRAGSVLLRHHENPDGLGERIEAAVEGLDLDIRATDTALCTKGPDLGGQRFQLLVPPRVAIATQWPVSTTSFGAIWHLLDVRLGLRSSPLSVSSLRFADLRKYNVIVLPHAWSTGGLSALIREETRKRLKSWMKAGGTLIAMGAAAAFLTDEDYDFSAVRLRRDVLDQLDVYTEAVEHERQARDISIDPEQVWGAGESDDQPGNHDDEDDNGGDRSTSEDTDTLERQDAWSRLFRPTGVIVSARLDPEHWLTFGLAEGRDRPDRLPVLLSGSHAFLSKFPVATPVRLEDESHLRMSGLLWPEARKRRASSAYATVEHVGYGQLILFVNDPFFRGYFEGSGRLLRNAIIFGPGLGASPPVPW